MENTKSKKGFNYAMLALIVFAAAFVTQLITATLHSEFLLLLVGTAAMVAFLLSIIGLVSSVRGMWEPISMEQIVGITVNGVFFVGLIYMITEVVAALN